MTAASTLGNQDRINNSAKIYIDNQVWARTRSVTEKNAYTPVAETTALIDRLETDNDQLLPAGSTKSTISNGWLQNSDLEGQFLPAVQATKDRKFMFNVSSILSLCMLEYSNYFVAFQSDAFASLEQIDLTPIASTSDPHLSQNTDVALRPVAVSQSNFTSIALQAELLRENDLVEEFGYYVLAARNEQFEDGMSSNFAVFVHESIRYNGLAAVYAWERVLHRYGNVYETGEELLRQLGLLQHVPSHEVRLNVLIDNLDSPDPRIRDAAGLGLSFLDDPNALSPLRVAYQSETESWLRRNLNLVINQLEAIA